MTDSPAVRGPDDESPASRLLRIVTGSWMSQATYVAARLGIPDLLADQPLTPAEIADATGGDPASLRRLLRALTTIEICREGSDGGFELTAMGSLLRSDAPDSLRSWTIYWGGDLWPLWGYLLESVRTGESARALVAGTAGFEHLAGDPATAEVFHRAMVELTRLIAPRVVEAYDFSGFERVVDVGGGYGELLAAILAANPATLGVLYDQPHAVENGRRHLRTAGLEARCEFVAGSFFESVPADGDAYVLKSVIHDWDDERARVILGNCRRAMARSGKVLLVERVMPERMEVSPDHQAVARSDLHMLLAHAARERTEAEFRDLLRSAGLHVNRVVPAGATFGVIEALPV